MLQVPLFVGFHAFVRSRLSVARIHAGPNQILCGCCKVPALSSVGEVQILWALLKCGFCCSARFQQVPFLYGQGSTAGSEAFMDVADKLIDRKVQVSKGRNHSGGKPEQSVCEAGSLRLQLKIKHSLILGCRCLLCTIHHWSQSINLEVTNFVGEVANLRARGWIRARRGLKHEVFYGSRPT